MCEDKYIYSLINANKTAIVLKILRFFCKESDSYKLIIYNTDKTIINCKDDYLEFVIEVIAGIRKSDIICPFYLELYNDSQVIFDVDTENQYIEYNENYHLEYINYISSLIGNMDINCISSTKINELISKLELILLNRFNYLRAIEKWGIDNVIQYDKKQIASIFSGEYKLLFDLYPKDIIHKLESFKDGDFNEQYFQDIIYQNTLIRLSIYKNE